MNITDFKQSLPYLFEAEVTAFVWGHKGIGKTSIPRDYAKEKGWKFFPFYLGAMSDNGDILGLAEFVKKANGGVATRFAMPEWLADCIQYCEENPQSGALILLDEFNRAPRSLLAGMFSFALDKTFHTMKLPKNCHIIAAGNPPTDEYVVTDIDEAALMSRFCHMKLEPTFQEWLDFAKDTKISQNLIEFYKNQPELLNEKHTDFNLPVKPDSRAVTRLDKIMKLNPPQHLLEQFMHGIIGLERTVAYMQFLKDQDKPLTGTEVLSHQKFHLIEKWSNPVDVVASCLNLTCDNLKEELIKRDANKTLLTPEEKSNLMAFLLATPKDISYSLIDNLAKNHKLEIFRNFYLDEVYKDKVYQLALSARGKAA